MLVDANLLLYAVDGHSPQHEVAGAWWTDTLNGPRRVGLPWASLGAFVRISTHPRASEHPLTPSQAWAIVEGWLDAPTTWIPEPGPRFARVLGDLLVRHRAAGNLVPDAMLAALALEHGIAVQSADSDFARFPEVPWNNPIA